MIRRGRITDDDAIDDNVTTSRFTANIAESLPGNRGVTKVLCRRMSPRFSEAVAQRFAG
jgi:hypothetical protein